MVSIMMAMSTVHGPFAIMSPAKICLLPLTKMMSGFVAYTFSPREFSLNCFQKPLWDVKQITPQKNQSNLK